MVCILVRIIGVLCGGIGMILTWIVTLMPHWRVSIIAENDGVTNIRLDGQWISRLDGLWQTCINHAQIAQQCNSYDSLASVSTDLKAGRVLMSFAVTMTLLAFLFSLVGMLLTKCDKENWHAKRCILLTSGIFYLFSAVLILIPVSWTTSNIATRTCDAVSCRGSVRFELGEALFLAWPTILFLIIGGIILCWICPCEHIEEKRIYVLPRDQEMVRRVRHAEDNLESCRSSPYI